MSPKKTSRRIKPGESRRRGRKRSFWQQYGLLAGVTAVVVIAVLGIVFLNQRGGADSTAADTADVSLDKSKGAEDAPVVVVEYGDFQ